ncbi:MAG TPA: hypothetical protein PKI80_09050 [Deltaproteobacteria bacterium]|nr:hypothetical protein [Deltaproteobacteria bacterium]
MFSEATQEKINQIIERLPQIGQAFTRQGLTLQLSVMASPLDSTEPRLDVSLTLAAKAHQGLLPAASPILQPVVQPVVTGAPATVDKAPPREEPATKKPAQASTAPSKSKPKKKDTPKQEPADGPAQVAPRDLMEREIAAKCARKGMTPEGIQGFKDFCAKRWFRVEGGFEALDEGQLNAIRTDLDTLIENYQDPFLVDEAAGAAAASAGPPETLFDDSQTEAPEDGPIAARYGIDIPDDADPLGAISAAAAQGLDKVRKAHGIEYSALARYLELQLNTRKMMDIKWGDVPAILLWMETNKATY